MSVSSPSSGPSTVSSPPARRTASATWRDPRLIVGVVIVAASVLLGVQLFRGADDSVSVWAAGSDLPAGTTVAATDLEPREIRFANAGDADRYLSADTSLPTGARLLRDVGAGELIPRAALGDAGSATLVEVPVAVAAEAVPATVRSGSVVDVWVTPETTGADEPVDSVLVFDDVVVVAAPRSSGSLGPSASRQIIIGVGPDDDGLAAALARVASGTTVVTKQG